MELHERWLAELRSERMKHKLALAEGRITNEEYMENNNQEKIDLFKLTMEELYQLRITAINTKNTALLADIKGYLNIWLDNQKVVHKHKFIEASDLIKGYEKVLVLVPNSTPEEMNANSIRFWQLQDIFAEEWKRKNVALEKYSKRFRSYEVRYILLDPTFEELRKEDGLVQQKVKEADVVLQLDMFNRWCVLKAPFIPQQKLTDHYHFLKFTEVTLNDIFVNNPKEIWVYVDHRLGQTNQSENLYHLFANHLTELNSDIKLHLMSGNPSHEWMEDKEIVLMADPKGFLVEQAKQTSHAQKVIPIKEVTGIDPIKFTLTSQCRTTNLRKVLEDGNIGNIHPKPLMPYEAPGQGYSNSIQSQEPAEQLSQSELAEMSIARFGFMICDPDTGMVINKEQQDELASKWKSSKQPKESK